MVCYVCYHINVRINELKVFLWCYLCYINKDYFFKIGNCDKYPIKAFRVILLFHHQKTYFSLNVWPVPASNKLTQL